jgi:hypothetical protein
MSTRFIKYNFRVRSQYTVVAGVAAPLSAISQKVSWVLIEADTGNSGTVYIGEDDVAANKCMTLAAGQSLEISLEGNRADKDLPYLDLTEIWADGTVSGDKINVSFLLQLREDQLDYA